MSILEVHSANEEEEIGRLRERVQVLESELQEERTKRQMLEQESEWCQKLLFNTPLIAFGLDRQGKFLYSQGKGLELLGLKPGEVVGQNAFLLYRDNPQIIEGLQRAYQGEEVFLDSEVNSRVFRARYSPLIDSNGRVTEIIGSALDITEQVQAERKLKDAAEFSALVIDCAACGIVLIGTDGKFRHCNPEAKRFLGLSDDEVQNRVVKDWEKVTFNQDGSPCPSEEYPVSVCLRTGQGQPMRLIGVKNLDGTTNWGVFGAVPFHDHETWELTGALVSFTDVTDLRYVTQRLRHTEERYRTLFETSRDGILFTDNQGRIIDVNESLLELLDYQRVELLGREIWELISTQSIPKTRNVLEHELKSGTSSEFIEIELIGKNYSLIPVELAFHRFEHFSNISAKGSSGYWTLIRDLRERKLAEQELARSNARFRQIVQNSGDAIFALDQENRIRFANPASVQLLGLEASTLIDHNILELIRSPHRPEFLYHVREAWINNQFPSPTGELSNYSGRCEVQLACTDPRWVDVQISGSPSTGDEVWLFLRDTTFRKQQEAALLEHQTVLEERVRERTRDLEHSESRWRSLVQSAAETILSIDRQGIITFLNRVKFSKSLKDVVNKHISSLIPERGVTYLNHLLRKVFETGESVEFEVDFSREGKTYWYSGNIAPIFQGEFVAQAIVVCRDISSSKEEAARLRRHQMELTHVGRLSTIGTMAAELAHELNQPLSAIGNYASGIIRRIDQRLNLDSIKPVLEEIRTQADRASKIFQRMRDFVKKQEFQQIAIEINSVVNNALELANLEIGRHEVTLNLELGNEIPLVKGDPLQIEQVLLNLILNALDAMDQVPVLQRELTIRTEPLSQSVRISVFDTGPGLQSNPELLFEPFFSTKPKGLGLGLSISRTIVENHSGRLLASNRENSQNGAIFFFEIPLST